MSKKRRAEKSAKEEGGMFIPPYDVLLRAIGTTREDIENRPEVTISTKFLLLLLQQALETSEFNEQGYLAANPDVAEAIDQGKVESAKSHYTLRGYFERRRGALPELDEEWYCKANPDVAQAIADEKVVSALDHYLRAGIDEFRPPNQACETDWSKWIATATRKPRVRL